MFKPKVSIIIPVYNGSNYMHEAIDSALNQTYENIEVIVVNDGSNDNGKTAQIAKSYGNKIRYFSKENGGVSTALNLGIRMMTGEYVSWLSHDDVYYPEKIEKQIEFLRNEPDKNIIVHCDFDVIDSKSNIIGEYRIKDTDTDKFRYALITGGPIHGCTPLIPKLCFDEVGLFNEELRTVQDKDMWFRISEKFKFKHIPDKLIKSRSHPEQGIKTLIGMHSSEREKLYLSFLEKLTFDELLYTAIYQAMTHYFRYKLKLSQKLKKLFSIVLLYFVKTIMPKSVLERLYYRMQLKSSRFYNWATINHSVFSIILILFIKSFIPGKILNKLYNKKSVI
ncbi:MAG: glycosyltransferase [Candidatus Hodarchaeota archaeon]